MIVILNAGNVICSKGGPIDDDGVLFGKYFALLMYQIYLRTQNK